MESKAITIEDFYKPEFMKPIVESIMRENKIEPLEGEWLLENNRVKAIKDSLRKKGKQGEEIKEIADNIKVKCTEKVKKQNIDEDKINPVLDKLLEKMGLSSKLQS
ncbi:MAG: hypothetical protein OXF52_02125 [Candidatus Dadabacteria bacterium]|nr:hypothetical protein [Candidatus Dadabacteria bacterium]